MRFLIYLLFVAIAVCDDGHPKLKQVKNTISIDDHNIPDNPWIGGVWNDFSFADSARWFKRIDYYKDITADDKIRLDYTMQKYNSGFWSSSWDHMFDDSVYLCDTSKKTQNASMIGLVRFIMGIPKGCPIEEDFEADVSSIHFPLQNIKMFWNYDIRGQTIRVLTNMWDNEKPAHKLFTGDFYIAEGSNAYRPV